MTLRQVGRTLIYYYYYIRSVHSDDISSVVTIAKLIYNKWKKKQKIMRQCDFMCHALLTNYWIRTVAYRGSVTNIHEARITKFRRVRINLP